MSRTLGLTRTLLSLRGRMAVTDAAGQLACEARGEFALWSPTWRIEAAGREIARVRRRVLSWRPTGWTAIWGRSSSSASGCP